MKKLLFLLCFIAGLKAYSQINYFEQPKFDLPSSASLMKYIEYPVSLNTGLVNIHIPLYEIMVGNILIPISLSYHASGIKVNELSGRVGMGWSLNAEPMVSRSINSKPDENGILKNNKIGSYGRDDIINLLEGYTEEDPDAFYYKLLNKSGKFYFNKSGASFEIVPHPWEPIRIDSQILNGDINNFRITDENGIDYLFDNIGRTNHQRTQWKASKVGFGSDAVYFSYQTHRNDVYNLYDYTVIEEIINNGYMNESYIESLTGCYDLKWPFLSKTDDTGNALKSGAFKLDNSLNAVVGPMMACSVDYPVSSSCITNLDENNLTTISTDMETIHFNGNNELSEIIVKDRSGNIIRKINFYLSYCNGPSSRRKLDSLQISGSAGIIEKYSFSYYNPESIPYIRSRSVDHWGYYNYYYNTTAAPRVEEMIEFNTRYSSTTAPAIIYGANKETNPNSIHYGSLKSITYPTGRKTTFIYSPNKDENDRNVGGLRIEKIQEEDCFINSKQTLLTRTFKYGKGKLLKQITQNDYMFEKIILWDQGYKSRAKIYLSEPIGNLVFDGGSPVYYTTITEFLEENGNSAGKTVYEYEHMINSTTKLPKTNICYSLDNSWMGGHLKKKMIYKNSGDFVKIQENEYEYSILKSNTKIAYRKIYDKLLFKKPVEGYEERWMHMAQNEYGYSSIESNILNGCKRLETEIVTNYDGAFPFVIKTTYQYNNNALPSTIHTTCSNGEISKIVNKYPDEINYSLLKNQESRLLMINKNMLATVLESSITKGGKTEGVKYLHKTHNNMPVLENIVKNTGIYYSDENRTTIVAYNNRNKPEEIISIDGKQTVFLWGHNSYYPVAKIEGNSYSNTINGLTDSEKALIKAGNAHSGNILNKIRDKYVNQALTHVSTYIYTPLIGITSTTDPAGITTTYQYDSFGRLINIKDNNMNMLQKFDYNYKDNTKLNLHQ